MNAPMTHALQIVERRDALEIVERRDALEIVERRDALEIVERRDALEVVLAPHRGKRRSIGFVPTMGALHDGHAALMRAARYECDVVVVSSYVNPRQFAAGEDLERYPRTPERDAELVSRAGADVLWAPRDANVYGGVEKADPLRAGPIGGMLEGAARPGHFDGVVQVVSRLLDAVRPTSLYLGEKDYQQVQVVRELVRGRRELVAIRTVATAREADGLARSSRNAYLTPNARIDAARIPAALDEARAAARGGERDPRLIEAAARAVLDASAAIDIDYVELVHPETLASLAALDRDGVLLIAAIVHGTRLIDNTLIHAQINESNGGPS